MGKLRNLFHCYCGKQDLKIVPTTPQLVRGGQEVRQEALKWVWCRVYPAAAFLLSKTSEAEYRSWFSGANMDPFTPHHPAASCILAPERSLFVDPLACCGVVRALDLWHAPLRNQSKFALVEIGHTLRYGINIGTAIIMIPVYEQNVYIKQWKHKNETGKFKCNPKSMSSKG